MGASRLLARQPANRCFCAGSYGRADSIEVVLAGPPRPPGVLGLAAARRLAARVRERGAVLLLSGATAGAGWPGPVDLELRLTTCRWEGLDRGHGHLQARLVEVTSIGRAAASRPRRARLWLPDRRGRVASAGPHLAPEHLVGTE